MTTDFRGQLTSSSTALQYLLAGDARITIASDAGQRFTFKVSAPKMDTPKGGRVTDFASPMRFVALADNERSFNYLGFIRDGGEYVHGFRKSRVSQDAPSVRTFAMVWNALRGGMIPIGFSIWHEGACARCGRTLTVPASIASGFGPDCAALLGIAQPEPVAAPVEEPVAIAGGSDLNPILPCVIDPTHSTHVGPCAAWQGPSAPVPASETLALIRHLLALQARGEITDAEALVAIRGYVA